MTNRYSHVTVKDEADEIDHLAARVREFVIRECIPEEAAWRATGHEVSEDLRRELMARARAAGLYGLHLPSAYGGRDLDHRGKAKILEAAGYSLLGPPALHCAAPDEGNQHLLHVVAQGSQREEYLRPLCEGERSCFLMTEPGGAGADPAMMKSVAVRDGDDYVITGRKWFITGAIGAAFAIIMARDGMAADAPPTMFLAPIDTPGINIIRPMEVMAHDSTGGHCIVDLDNVRVHKDQILGEPGEAFRYAQVRLAPARLTHCMRWLGAAVRCHDVARSHAAQRHLFGNVLGRHQGASFMLADNEIDLYAARQVTAHACAVLDSGATGRHESSMAKVFVSEATSRVADRAVQILGGLGVTSMTPVEHIYRSIRAFRIYDGPSEAHRMAIGRRALPNESEMLPDLTDF
ncbi:acyl-CoA dehydrogenase [Pseudaminobacter arsenicus]|uniref:Acyl-CoA dehydrogenase n=1 Tax=Borborobacter arsenicus TaxID=1851146 RepID=A0A432V7X3_9HYPH|nr:acyl-CoA dehydrogenase family protein [Pseudaminobacter arsenicus]RUM98173.1 acyl-CoA dehydrogenase [Pseudaminobacter arsenicus]